MTVSRVILAAVVVVASCSPDAAKESKPKDPGDPPNAVITDLTCCTNLGLDFETGATVHPGGPSCACGVGFWQLGWSYVGLRPSYSTAFGDIGPEAELVEVGKVGGLLAIDSVPSTGFGPSVPVRLGHSYVVRMKTRDDTGAHVFTHARYRVLSLFEYDDGSAAGSRVKWTYQADGNTAFDGSRKLVRVRYERVPDPPMDAGTDSGEGGPSPYCSLVYGVLPPIVSSLPGVSCPDDCADGVPPGSAVVLTPGSPDCSAKPNCCLHFAGWKGDGCSGSGACTLTVSADTTVTAMVSRTGAGGSGGSGGAAGAGGVGGAAGAGGAGGTSAGGTTGLGGSIGKGGTGGSGGTSGSGGSVSGGSGGTGGSGPDAGCVAASCKQLLACGTSASGAYALDVAGTKLTAYCDMTSDGGGWTLIAKNTTSGLVDFNLWKSGEQSAAALTSTAPTATAWFKHSTWDPLVGSGGAVVRQVNDSSRTGFWVFSASATPFSARLTPLTCESAWAGVSYHATTLGSSAHAPFTGSCGGHGLLGTNAADAAYPNGVVTTFFGNFTGMTPWTGSAEDGISGAHSWYHASTLWLREG